MNEDLLFLVAWFPFGRDVIADGTHASDQLRSRAKLMSGERNGIDWRGGTGGRSVTMYIAIAQKKSHKPLIITSKRKIVKYFRRSHWIRHEKNLSKNLKKILCLRFEKR
jgi:hypothetical protein